MANRTMEEIEQDLEHLKSNIDVFFLFTMGTIVFFMQCGFAFLEAGAVRSKNTTNILIKNILDVFIGGIAYWVVGYALAFGRGNPFCGTSMWAGVGVEDERLAFWFFQFVFAATAATIVSGSMAERCAFHAYLIYSVVLTAVVYPIVSHWAWSEDGWLAGTPYQDFAGSGVVHLTGGVAALVGSVILGPRYGRFGPTGKVLRGHSVPLAALGGFILLFGFLAFNGGSQASISHEGDAGAVAKAVVNTVISGCFGGVTALLVYRSRLCGRPSNWSFLMALNGALTAMVAICAGCNVLPTWGSCITGVVAGLVFLSLHVLLPRLSVDDPLDAVAVHMGGGLWGLVAVGLLQEGGGVRGGSLVTLGWNLVGALAIVVWAGGVCVVMFGALRYLGWLRVSVEMEMQGMDILKHGEPAYPAEAWLERQYSSTASSKGHHDDSNDLPPNMTASWRPQAPHHPHHNGLSLPPGPDAHQLPADHHELAEVTGHATQAGRRSQGHINEGFEVERL
ncbi:putative ammonium transporter 1 [Portunus trituberculatus]|uniref:putative ammonium transporter 1 n=1 Tax=Portunus trituberculatus TaxID=210409 RepID=UPI001E1CBAA3|nr:putative ammonium transporter 1 [Portunus trituberculatus]